MKGELSPSRVLNAAGYERAVHERAVHEQAVHEQAVYERVVHEFAPVYDGASRILILGTFPSVRSREQHFYYGHPQNRFWRVLAAVLGEDVPQTIEDSGNVVIGILSSETSFEFQNISVLQLPNGRSVLVATAPPDGSVHAPDDKPYDVVAVKINDGERLSIKASVRPDYYQGQTLVLNVDFPTQS